MQGNLSQQSRTNAVSLGANHGYRFEGDTAFLNAELAIDARESLAREGWALQLWACDAPYEGGTLRGIKVAEAPLALDGASAHLEANAPAQLPPAQRDYAMVLVLAANGQVQDFSNYATRQAFAGPHLNGSVGYRFEDAEVVLQASVRNPRLATNLSGTLALELWATSEAYAGGELAGTRLAQVELGSVNGQSELDALELRAPRAQAPAGAWQLALVLREWTSAGYQTRDFCSFPVAYRVEPQVRVVQAPVAVHDEPPRAQAQAEARPVEPPTLKLVETAKAVEPAKAAPAPAAKAAAPASKRVEAPAPKAAEPAPKLALKALAKSEQRVSITTAGVAELAAVDGLNLKLAQAIVRARPYASLDDLTRVRGVGDKLLQKLRAQLTL